MQTILALTHIQILTFMQWHKQICIGKCGHALIVRHFLKTRNVCENFPSHSANTGFCQWFHKGRCFKDEALKNVDSTFSLPLVDPLN